MDQKSSAQKVPFSVKMGQIKQLIGSRMMIGIYIGQYCINALTYFFITWFPVYLVQARGMSILKPACRLHSGGVRLCRRGAGRGDLRLVNAPHRLAEHCAQKRRLCWGCCSP